MGTPSPLEGQVNFIFSIAPDHNRSHLSYISYRTGLYLVLLLNKLNNLMLFILFTRRHVISVSTWSSVYSPLLSVSRTQVNTLSLVFVNIKPQKDYLKMNSACLCVNEWRRRAVLFTTEACVMLPVILTSASH